MEAAGLLEAQQLGDPGQAVGTVAQVILGQLPAHVVQYLGELHALARQAALQGTLADAQAPGHGFYVADTHAQALDKQAMHTVAVGDTAQLVHPVFGETTVQQRQGFVGRAQGHQQRLLVEQNAGAAGTETQATVEQSLVLGDVRGPRISELDLSQPRQATAGQPAAETQHAGHCRILERPWPGSPHVDMLDTPEALATLLLQQLHREAVTQQRSEAYQGLERLLQVGAGHHRITHQLESPWQKILVGAQAYARIAGHLRRQLHQPIDVRPGHEAFRVCQLYLIEPHVPAQTLGIQPHALEHVHHLTDETDTDPVHRRSPPSECMTEAERYTSRRPLPMNILKLPEKGTQGQFAR